MTDISQHSSQSSFLSAGRRSQKPQIEERLYEARYGRTEFDSDRERSLQLELSEARQRKQVERMTNLREETLIKKGFKYFLLPNAVLGALACFFPLVYLLIPVHEADQCLCSYYKSLLDGSRTFWVINAESNYLVLRGSNTASFILVNWCFLVVLLYMIYRIRHIHDDTMIRMECVWIVFTWVSLSFVQYVLFLLYGNVSCTMLANGERASYSRFLFTSTFWIILARDFLITGISAFFCWQANKNFKENPSFAQYESADPSLLDNFGMLLESVVPNQFFTVYIQKEKPQFAPYLRVIHCFKLREYDITSSQEIEQRQSASSKESASLLQKLNRRITQRETEIQRIALKNRSLFVD